MRPWLSKWGGAALLGLALVAMAATAARADRILTTKRIGISGQITGLEPGGLVIDSEGNKQVVPLADIDKIKVDQYPDFERAETAYAKGAAGDAAAMAEAEKLYRGLSGSGVPPWLKTLVQARMFKVYADTLRVPEALDAFLEIAKNQPKFAASLKLPDPNDEAHEANVAMLKKVEDILKTATGKLYTPALNTFKVELMILEGKPEEVQPLLENLLKSPDEKTRLAAMLKQVDILVSGGKVDEGAAKLEEWVPALTKVHPDDIAYWRGRILKDRGQHLEAALQFMRVAIVYPAMDRSRTAESLFLAGQEMQAAKAPKAEIAKVYTEAVSKYAGTSGAERAKRELARLGS